MFFASEKIGNVSPATPKVPGRLSAGAWPNFE
jgi:hypothetical protein